MSKKGKLRQAFQTFCEESSLHGVQFVAPSKCLATKATWGILLAFALAGAALVCNELFTQWSDSPIVTTIESTSYSVRDIPFPSVTICPEGYNPWGMTEKLLNAIEVNQNVKEDFQIYFDQFEATIDSTFKNNLNGPEAKQKLLDSCSLFNNTQCLIIVCMNELLKPALTYQQANDLEKELSKSVSKSFFIPTSMSWKGFLDSKVVPVLQAEVQKRNITCEDCFLAGFSVGFILPRKLDSLLCYNDSTTLCVEKLKMIVAFLDRVLIKPSIGISNLGTFVASRSFKMNENYHQLLLSKLEANSANIVKYENIVKALGVKEKIQEYGYITHAPNDSYGSFETIFRIMKENIYQPHMIDLVSMEQGNFTGNLEDLAEYPELLTNFTLTYKLKKASKNPKELITNLEPYIPFCKLANKWSDLSKGWGSIKYTNDKTREHFSEFCTLFRPTLTDYGICYSFNAIRSEDLLKRQRYMQSYKKVFGHKKSQSGYFQASGTGVQNGIEIVLDAHNLDARYKSDYKNAKNTFKLSLQHPEDFPLPAINGLTIKGGFKTSIVISPQVLKSTKDINDIEMGKRQCGFNYESSSLKFFKMYNHNACLFECMWSKAKKLSNCVPWYFIQDSDEDFSQICHSEGNFQWTEIFQNSSNQRDCNCPYDCNKKVYPYFTNQHEMTALDCASNEESFVKVRAYLENYQKEGHLYDIWKLRDVLTKSSKDLYPVYNCSQRLRDIAIVEIFYGTPFALKLKMDVSATFMTKLASIGGSLGLFCGMSIMTVFEIILALFKAFLRVPCSK